MYKATNHKPVSWIPREMKAKKISCNLDHEFHAKSCNNAKRTKSNWLSWFALPWQEQWQMPDSNDSKDKWIRSYEFSRSRNLSKLSPCAHSVGSWFDRWSFGDQSMDHCRITSWVMPLLSWTIDDRQDFGLIERVNQLAMYWNIGLKLSRY